MERSPTPRQMAKGLLSGIAPLRPLFLPIVFSLGAKVESVPLSAFLGNPAKISSALRQMRTHLRSDGVACYFDPYLAVEALGATLQRISDDRAPTIHWPRPARMGELPEGLRSREEAANSGRVPVAVEVIRRMNALPNRDFLLTRSSSRKKSFRLSLRRAALSGRICSRPQSMSFGFMKRFLCSNSLLLPSRTRTGN